jgi:hypothetical protein
MELNTVTLGDFVQLADVIFEKNKQSLMQEAFKSGMFVTQQIPMNSGNIRQYNEIDLEEYASRKAEGAQAVRAQVQEGYSKNLTSYRVAKDIGITYEMRTQNKYPEVVRRLTNLANLGINRRELDLTHRVTFCESTTYTDQDGYSVDVSLGDSLSLANTAHLLKGTASTYRNRLANNPQFSRGALEGMEANIVSNTLSQFGQKVTIPFDIIFTTDDPNMINTVREFLRSTASVDPGMNQGVVNVYKGKYRHVVLPRIATNALGDPDTTKTKYWGLASSTYSTAHCDVWEEPHLKVPSNLNAGEEFSTDDWNFGVRAGYGICIVNGFWFQFSSGDGTP